MPCHCVLSTVHEATDLLACRRALPSPLPSSSVPLAPSHASDLIRAFLC
ncbi:hypothetical protein U9M48_004010 [Paspalum notatum var. saurae]|uniref:Uncharacterized protein n=1 Tax=Paspalum notatum var. saurae TaxID=547442 RepID=A0AAQ3PU47_PASNO